VTRHATREKQQKGDNYMERANATTREFDLIVWGASGYMGQLIVEHLLATHGINKDLRWAMGGRNISKLETIRDRLGSDAAQIPIVHAESHDRAQLDAMVQRARVICSSVGPYQLYGEDLVASCINNGADYCDLTGEFAWIREMIDKYEDLARQNNVRIVHSCGFDSLPSDLGTLFVENKMKERYGVFSPEVKMRVRHGFVDVKPSGGTIASILNAFELIARNRKLLKLAYDPGGLLPREDSAGAADSDIKFPKYEKEVNSWVAPYLMAAGNTKIVQRGNALMNRLYGRNFRYGEGMCTGPGFKGWWRATGATFGFYLFTIMLAIRFTRVRLKRKLPRPGEGMTREERESRSYKIAFTAYHPDDSEKYLQVEIAGKRDMGYGSSARMIGEAAACLALDGAPRSMPGGFWTPASCMGEALIHRLEKNAEITFTELLKN